MNTRILTALCVTAFALVSLRCDRGVKESPRAPLSSQESAYSRVMRTRVLRAAYINYPPGCVVDPHTRKVSGVFVDLLRQIGTDTGLKVEYTEEVGWGTMIEGLNASRYDVIGSPVWANPARGARATLSSAVYFTPIGVWVRSDDTRFASATAIPSINAPDIRIAAMDGSTPELIARTQFPAAKLIGYPDITGEPQLFLDVVQKKADVFFAEPALGAQFLRSHPGSLRDIAAAAPIRSFANVYMMRANEPALKMLIDTALQDLDSRGVIDALLQKYEPVSGAFLRRAVPYRTANGK